MTTIRQSLESPIGRAATNLPRDQNYYDLGIAASWELDIFGQFRKGAQAASAEAQAAEASHAGTRISISAEAADAYVQIRSDQARIAFAEEQIQTDERLLRLIRQRFEAGVSTDRKLRRQKGSSRKRVHRFLRFGRCSNRN